MRVYEIANGIASCIPRSEVPIFRYVVLHLFRQHRADEIADVVLLVHNPCEVNELRRAVRGYEAVLEREEELCPLIFRDEQSEIFLNLEKLDCALCSLQDSRGSG